MAILDEIEALLRVARKAKTEKELREVIAKLEAEVQRLSGELAQFEPRGERCPSCGKLTAYVTQSVPDPTFGSMGAILRTYTCKSCGFAEDRSLDPG